MKDMIFIDTYKKNTKTWPPSCDNTWLCLHWNFFYILHACKNAVYSLTLIISTVLNSTYQKYHLKDLWKKMTINPAIILWHQCGISRALKATAVHMYMNNTVPWG